MVLYEVIIKSFKKYFYNLLRQQNAECLGQKEDFIFKCKFIFKNLVYKILQWKRGLRQLNAGRGRSGGKFAWENVSPRGCLPYHITHNSPQCGHVQTPVRLCLHTNTLSTTTENVSPRNCLPYHVTQKSPQCTVDMSICPSMCPTN
jgi:hypothetical protein